MGLGDFLKGIVPSALNFIPGVGPLLGAGASAILGGIGNSQNQNAIQQQRGNENAYTNSINAAHQNAIDRLKANGVDIFGPTHTSMSQFGTTGTTGNSRTVSDQSFRNNPFITAQYAPMLDRINSLINNRLGQSNAVTEAEKAAQIRNINNASAGALASVRNLAGHGFSGAQLAAAGTPIQMARAGQIGNYMATLPDLERQRRNEDINMASGVANTFGKGEEGTSHGVSNTSGSSVTNSNGGSMSTGGPDYSAILGLTTPAGPQETLNTGSSPWIGAGQDMSALLGNYLLSRRKGKTNPTTTPSGVTIENPDQFPGNPNG